MSVGNARLFLGTDSFGGDYVFHSSGVGCIVFVLTADCSAHCHISAGYRWCNVQGVHVAE